PAPESQPVWERIRLTLYTAMSKLNGRDRNAVLLRYFEGKSLRAIGLAMGLSDDAAQKRVSRALDKLRALLTRGGATISGSSLSAILNTGAMAQPRSGLAMSVAQASLARAAVASGSCSRPVRRQTLASAKTKLAVACLLALLIGGGVVHL